jgi:hypothetical protein
MLCSYNVIVGLEPGLDAARAQYTPTTRGFKYGKCTIRCQKDAKPNRNAQRKPGSDEQNQSHQPSVYPPFMVDVGGE